MFKYPVFVYGTLLSGCENHDLLDNVLFVGKAKTKKKGLLYIINNIPYLNFKRNGKNIKGELYLVDERTLKDLDDLEGHPHFYKRILEKIQLNGWELYGYIYHFPVNMSTKYKYGLDENNKSIIHYDYKKYRKRGGIQIPMEELDAMEALNETHEALRNLLDHIDSLDGCDCGGSGLCPVCNALRIIEENEENFPLDI
ncbi:MAG: gamma-glutamylcyclotransferase family protein [Candidatus Woesearchaeota archaeon]